jgi:hypothetical protein
MLGWPNANARNIKTQEQGQAHKDNIEIIIIVIVAVILVSTFLYILYYYFIEQVFGTIYLEDSEPGDKIHTVSIRDDVKNRGPAFNCRFRIHGEDLNNINGTNFTSKNESMTLAFNLNNKVLVDTADFEPGRYLMKYYIVDSAGKEQTVFECYINKVSFGVYKTKSINSKIFIDSANGNISLPRILGVRVDQNTSLFELNPLSPEYEAIVIKGSPVSQLSMGYTVKEGAPFEMRGEEFV